ncbi:unnamed protein product [Merluccius merluccius]
MERDSSETPRPGRRGDWWTEAPPAGLGPGPLQRRDAAAAAGMLHRVRQKLLHGAVVLCTLFLLLWMSSFIYGSFYYSFMPKAAYSIPVMWLGQAYRISLELEMPDSPTNQQLGMLMVRMTCYSKEEGRMASSAHSVSQLPSASSTRFTMLRYSSDLLRTLSTLLFLPGFLSGMAQQTQRLEVELFSDYTEDPFSPSVEAMVEVLSSEVQIYSAQLHIYADFTSLRYLLYHYPVMSALVGVSSNLVFLSVLLFYSYMRQLMGGTWTTRLVR